MIKKKPYSGLMKGYEESFNEFIEVRRRISLSNRRIKSELKFNSTALK